MIDSRLRKSDKHSPARKEEEDLPFLKGIKSLKGLFAKPAGSDKSGPSISTAFVRRQLVDSMEPALAAIGFERFDRSRAWRHREKWVDVVEIQFIKTHTTTPHSPSLHIGRYFTFVPEDAISGPVLYDKGRMWPSPELCHFRKSIYKTVKQRETKVPNIWFVGPHGEYLDECIEDVASSVRTQIIPWFNHLDDLNVVLELLQNGSDDIEGKDPDLVKRGTWNFTNYFSKYVVTGLVAFELRQWNLVVKRLAPILEHGGVVGKNGKIFSLPNETLGRIKIAYNVALQELGKD